MKTRVYVNDVAVRDGFQIEKDFVPTTIARRWSFNAPATISEAEAEPPLISTTNGFPSVRSPTVAL